MKIVRHDERVLELRGRDRSGEQGAGGFMFWIACAFFGGLFLIGLIMLWQITDGFRRIPGAASILGWAFIWLPWMVLFPALVSLLFKREALILDLELSRGIYKKWRFSQRSAKQQEFRFDQVDSVSFECKIEVVTDQEGHSSEYEKWISKLRLRQRTTIPLCKLGNEVKAKDIAEKVCKALGVELLDKTVERGAERIAAKDLDRPLASVRRRKHAPRAISLEEVKFPDPPPETTTQLHVDKAAKEIRLEFMEKRIGDAVGAVVLLFIGIGMAVTGGGFWFLVWTERADRQSAGEVAIPFTVIFIAGLILIVVAPLIYSSKEHLTITSTHLVRNVRLPGHRLFASIPIFGKVLSHLQDQIPLSEIESVRTNSRGNPPRVDVRSDKKILRVSKGQEDAEKLKWIAAVLRSGIRAMGH